MRVPLAHHSLRFRVHTRALLTLLVAMAVTGVLWAGEDAQALLRAATVASQAGDSALALTKLEAARAARPDYPRVRSLLARAYVAAGKPDQAVAELRALADFGLSFSLANDPALAGLSSHADWPTVAERLARNAAPQGRGDLLCELPDRDGIVESVALAPDGRWLFGDVRNRCVWQRAADGRMSRLTAADAKLPGVFSLAVDARAGVLWAGLSAVKEMRGYTEADRGRASLAQFDLENGKLLREFPVPADGREHVLGSIAVASDGSVFATDSASPTIWRLAPGAATPERWLEHAAFRSLQGLAFSADASALYVADYGQGLWRIDLASRAPRLLAAPAGTTLFAIDDLQRHGRDLIAVQNGFAPHRVVRIALDERGEPHAVTVLESGHPALTDAGTGTLANGAYVFVGNSGWELFPSPDATPAPRPVTIFRTTP